MRGSLGFPVEVSGLRSGCVRTHAHTPKSVVLARHFLESRNERFEKKE